MAARALECRKRAMSPFRIMHAVVGQLLTRLGISAKLVDLPSDRKFVVRLRYGIRTGRSTTLVHSSAVCARIFSPLSTSSQEVFFADVNWDAVFA
jgi:hypothetical protein